MLRACLLVCSLVSGTTPTLQYQHSYSRSDEPCKICYGDDCLHMDQARCEYYVETEGILHEEEMERVDNPELREEVDRLMYGFMEKASASQTECVPLVSQYMNCNKENICTGCKICNCDVNGSWNCTTVTKCRADVTMDVDHRILVFTMENLMKARTNKRIKRDTDENLIRKATNKITFEQLSNWMFDEPSNTEETTQNSINSTLIENETSIPAITETLTPKVDSSPETNTTVDYLGFEEVLNNIAVDSKAYSRRKPLKIHNDSTTFDYMIFNEDNATETATYKPEDDHFESNYAPSIVEGEADTIIDLLESAKMKQGDIFAANWTDDTETDNQINMIDPALDYIDNFVSGTKNVMKRDTSISEIKSGKANITTDVNELRNNVLLPLSNIINDKQKELEELLRVSENLIKIMRNYKNETIGTSVKENTYDTNSSIAIYNFEITPEFENEFRKNDKNLLPKYLMKLKRDIYEVIRDVARIQKLKTANIPQDLKILLRAMKYYLRSQAKLKDKQNTSEIKISRRKPDNIKNETNKKTLVSEMVDILKVIDKNMPESNALASLSPASRKLIQRIITNNYIDEFSVIGLRVFDPEYNLTKDINKIGTEWPKMTDIVAKAAAQDRLYAMKLLHLILSIDIIKMNDAMALLDFAYSRRMILVEGNLGGEIMDRINKGLKAINEKIKVIIQLHKNKHIINQKKLEVTKKIQKESFLRKLKNILSSSKSDILSMLKNKVPKKEIVKGLAKKKMDELTSRRFMEFEDTMRKWQSKLNLVPRDKRFARDDDYKNRMKSILPKYLRRKVKPAIAAKKSKKLRKHGKQKYHSKTATAMKSKFNTSSSTL